MTKAITKLNFSNSSGKSIDAPTVIKNKPNNRPLNGSISTSNSCLNCQKAIKDFGLKLLSTDEALEIMKKQVSQEAPHFLANSY